MSHHGEEHAPEGVGQAHPPPGIPEVKDEAGDTPPWVPKLGIIVVGLLLALIAYGLVPLPAPEEAPAADEQTEKQTEP